MKARSSAPILILVLLLVAAAGAAVWFLVLRPHQAQQASTPPGSGATAGSAVATTGSGPTATAGSGAAGSAVQTGSAAQAGHGPRAELVDTVIGANVEHATVEVVGTDQSGPAPFTAKLEKARPYKVRVAAPTFLAVTLDLQGGDDKQIAKLAAKPRVISVNSDPPGALVFIDSGATGHTTPFDIELTAAQAAKRAVRVKLRKTGYLTLDRVVEIAKLTEDDTRMITQLDEKLTAQNAANAPIRAGAGAGSAKGSGHDGSNAGGGSAQEGPVVPTAGSGQGSATGRTAASTPPAPTPPAPPPPATGSASEPEPAFNKPAP